MCKSSTALVKQINKLMQKRSPYLKAIEQSHNHLTDDQIIELIKKLHKERRIDYCMGLIEILRKRKTTLTKQFEEEIIFIAEIYTKTERCLDYFKESTEGWRVDKLIGKNTLSSKIIHKGQALIRFDGEVEIDVFNLCSMIYETALYNTWIPFCGESKDVKTVGIAAKVAYIKFNLPFISDREGYFYGQGIDRVSSTGSVIVYVEGITNNKAEEKRLDIKIKKNEKCTDLDLKFLVCEVKMLSEKLYTFRAFAHVDTRLSFLPEFVLGFFSKKIGSWLIDKLLKNANNFKGTQWEKKVQQSTDLFYPWLREKISLWKKDIKNLIKPEDPPRPVGSKPPGFVEAVEKPSNEQGKQVQPERVGSGKSEEDPQKSASEKKQEPKVKQAEVLPAANVTQDSQERVDSTIKASN